MYNIIYFEKNINDLDSKALKVYLKAINDNLIQNPCLFCDTYSININNIPIFHTFYIQNHFNHKLILVNKFDAHYLIEMGRNNIIVVYDSVVENIINNATMYDYSSNSFNKFIEEMYHEKL